MTSEAEARGILGVGPHADADEIRRAYRRLARRSHPDAGGEADEFLRLQQALATLLDSPRPARPTASPSTSRMTRPSTSTRMGATGWGESSVPRWHDDDVDLSGVDWDLAPPDPPHAWTRDLVAVMAAQDAGDGVLHPLTGVSRRPGSRLNRFVGWLSTDLVARWRVGPADTRGIRGHDVELRIELPSGGARKRGDQADWPVGWTRERRPSTTIVTFVVTPSRDRRATALRAADHLRDGLEALGWPLQDWYRVS